MKKKTINLSIVIPTLGEDSLFHCIDSIKKNTFLPKEILLVIPRNLSYKIEPSFENENFIKIIKTEFQGQVIQKIHGFKLSKSNFEMRLIWGCNKYPINIMLRLKISRLHFSHCIF